MTAPQYIVGIDLGTTHCVVGYSKANPDGDEAPEIHLFPIPQVVSPGEVKAEPLLPSFLLLPGPHDVPEGGLALPWDTDITWVVGEYARNRGAELPNRLVASAKSWLCHPGIDRREPILPWEAPVDAQRVSPLEASARYLAHIRNAWNHQMAASDPTARLEDQEIYLTVPASFDAVARELTVQAAQAAGLGQLTLLEEPQASFYAWIHAQGEGWRKEIAVGESILICDIGGGTTDFSLIQAAEEEGNLELRRVAVGDHILLGGDNMDLTLAYAVRAKLAQRGVRLDNWQFRSLAQSCRNAKERLLSNPDLEAEPLVILGRGSSLIGGTIRSELTRAEVESILVQGFFPLVAANDYPQRKPQVGIREMGLPYEADPAISRHLAYFLSRHVGAGGLENEPEAGVAYPSAVLFNGGVMKAPALRKQVRQLLRQWQGEGEVRQLQAVNHEIGQEPAGWRYLDHAVALGATYYGLARKGRGLRIRAGTSRSYYIGVESTMPAVPGIPTPVNALCVVPFGMEEGTEADIRQREFGLVVGQLAVFQLLGSTTRKTDQVGDVVEDWSDELQEVATMETQLPAAETEGNASPGALLPVWLQSKVTEIGTLELWCVARNEDRKWKLEFNIREQPPTHEQ